jgi:hypothetical protein
LVSKELKLNHPIPVTESSETRNNTNDSEIDLASASLVCKPLSFTVPYPRHMQDFIDYLNLKNEMKDDYDDDYDL